MNKIIRLAEIGFIILGLSFFSGVFGVNSLALVLPPALITLIRFSILGISILLVCIFWRSAIATARSSILICIFSLLALISFAWSVDPTFTLSTTRDIVMMTSFGLYFATRFSLKEQVQIIALTLFIGAFMSIAFSLGNPKLAVHGIAGIGTEAQNHQGSWKGVYGHKNSFGSMMVLTFLTFWTLPKETSKLYRWLGLMLAVILLQLSRSVTAMVISVFLILIMLFYKQFRWRGKLSVIFLDIGIIFLGCLGLIVFSYWVEIVTGLGKDPTITGRTHIWGVALNRFMERPLLGYGRGAFWAPNSRYAIEAGNAIGPGGWIPPHAHNGLIDLALDVGLIGVLIFLVCYFKTFTEALKRAYANNNTENIWPLGYLIFMTMNNVTENCLLYLTNVYWVLFITVVFTLNNTKYMIK